MQAVLLAATLAVGCLLAVQASANLQLSRAVTTPYGASTLQLLVATGFLAAIAIAVGSIGSAGRATEVPWWHLLGGLASPLYIMSGILLFPRLGALAAVGLFVTGQVGASVALDAFGLIGVPRRSVTVGVVVGVVAVLAGITLVIRQGTRREVHAGARQASASAGPAPGRAAAVAWTALGIAAGAALPVQGAVNARLRADLGAPVTVGLISFAVATTAIAVVLGLMLAIRRTPRPQFRPLATMPWWGWLGGLCAAAYVTATFLLIPEIGAATTVALTVTGQQLSSAVIDNYGLLRLPKRVLTSRRLAGLAAQVTRSDLVQQS